MLSKGIWKTMFVSVGSVFLNLVSAFQFQSLAY